MSATMRKYSETTAHRGISAEAYGQALDIVAIMGGIANIIPLGHVEDVLTWVLGVAGRREDGEDG